MHFWIDKRSQCTYTGRPRVPSSLSSGVGVGRGRGRYGAGVGVARKGMAAPVHRFAPIDCPPRRPPSTRHSRHNGTAAVHSARRQNDEPSLYVEIPPEPPQPTIASLAAARSVTPDTLLRTAALGLHQPSPLMAPHLKFGMLVSFALATLFLAGAKFYFDKHTMVREREAGGGGASVACAAVAGVCGVGCALALCRARPAPPPVPPERVSSTAQRHARALTVAPHAAPHAPRRAADRPPSEPSDDISLSTLLQSQRAEGEAPPPYHIAVLLPGREPPRDVSPPAYSALS